ncbi:MAG: hypothetical protein ACI9EF_000100 [Pseudohongiellaceae bacterium]|jgi:hypothetical protein
MVSYECEDELVDKRSQRASLAQRTATSSRPRPGTGFSSMKLLIPVLSFVLLAPIALSAPFQDAQGSGPSPKVPINPAGSQLSGVPVEDISSHRVESLPYVRRMDDIVSLADLLAEVDLTADPVLTIGQRALSQAKFRRRALMYLGMAEVEQTITTLITLAEIDRRVAQGDSADNYLPSGEDVDRKIEEIKELVRMNAEQQVAQRTDGTGPAPAEDVGDIAVQEFLKSIDSSVGQQKYRDMLGAEAAFEKVFLPFPAMPTNEPVHDQAIGPVPEDDPKPDWLPEITWNALAIDDSGKTLRQFVKGAGSRGDTIPAFFKGQVLTRIRAGVVSHLGVEYFFDHSDLPAGVFMRLGGKGVAHAEADVVAATDWIEGSKVALQASAAALADAQVALSEAQIVAAAKSMDAVSSKDSALEAAEVAVESAMKAYDMAVMAAKSAPSDLEAAVAAVPASRAAVKDVTTDELWHLVAGTLSDADYDIILREALTLEAMERTLKQAGRWLGDEEFEVVYQEHEDVYKGTLFPLSAIIMFRGYSSLDRYREHYRYREAYRRWRKDTMNEDDLENHYREGGRLFFERGSVHVDMAFKGVSNVPFTEASLDNALAELTMGFGELGSPMGEGEEVHPMSFEELLLEYPKPVVQNPQGADRAFQRNPLRLRMTESDLSIFLTGYSLADDLFYHGSAGEFFGPYLQKCRRHAWGAELNAGAWIVRVDKFTRSRPLAPLEGTNRDQAEDDFLDLNYLYWSQECLESLLERVTVGG